MASPQYEHLARGMELAHSWATDGHKWLKVPYDCGYAFVAEAQAHQDSMSYHASYLSHQSAARDPLTGIRNSRAGPAVSPAMPLSAS